MLFCSLSHLSLSPEEKGHYPFVIRNLSLFEAKWHVASSNVSYPMLLPLQGQSEPRVAEMQI